VPKFEFSLEAARMLAARAGPELETILRANGLDLPVEVTGADIVFAFHEGWLTNLTDEDRAFLSRGVAVGLGPVADIIHALANELPDGMASATFKEQLLQRVRAWATAKRRSGIDGAASA